MRARGTRRSGRVMGLRRRIFVLVGLCLAAACVLALVTMKIIPDMRFEAQRRNFSFESTDTGAQLAFMAALCRRSKNNLGLLKQVLVTQGGARERPQEDRNFMLATTYTYDRSLEMGRGMTSMYVILDNYGRVEYCLSYFNGEGPVTTWPLRKEGESPPGEAPGRE